MEIIMRTKIMLFILLVLPAFVLLSCPNPTNQPEPSDSLVWISTISGVTTPVVGATPVRMITETEQFSGTVEWSGAPSTFAPNTVYTATITLTAKDGFTFEGMPADYFYLVGATATSVTNSADSGVVIAVFPAVYIEFYTSNNIGTLKYVPAGRFQRDYLSTNISVITQPYRISQHEITRAQFNAIMGVDPLVEYNQLLYADANSTGTTDPVIFVSWYDAIAFCNKLSLAEGLTPVYDVTIGGTPVDWSSLTYSSIPTIASPDWDNATANWSANGYRLPTEMEWMWAAMGAPDDGQRGGTNNTGYLKAFAGSMGRNKVDDYTWYYGNSSDSTHPVGTKFANELGLYDMSGNVSEWCWDKYIQDGYLTGIITDYRGPVWGDSHWPDQRAPRGGAWNNDKSLCSVAYRGRVGSRLKNYCIGFRVVRS